MKPTISVILPVWKPNHEQLKLCLESLVKQTYSDFEIILIYRKAQGFDDDFNLLVDEYHDDKRFKVIEGKRSGFVNSLNEGITNATGELIARMDSDDYCDIHRFEKQLAFRKDKNCDIVGSWAYSVSNNGNVIGKIELPVTHSEIRKKMMFHCPMLHPSILMDKKTFVDIGLYDPAFIHAEDYDLYFRAMAHNHKFGNVPEYLVYIRENTESRSRSSEWRMQRRYYIKAKNRAFLKYGFVRYYDILYHMLTPLSYIISPQIAYKVKRATGWYKK